MTSLLLAIFAGGLIYLVIRMALDGARLLGQAQAEQELAEKLAAAAKKQAEIMGEDRTETDAADRLDSGTF